MTREEHLQWAKKRALECVDRGDLSQAVTSLISNLRKHEELGCDGFLVLIGMSEMKSGSAESVRDFINSFN
jgi:hypothetical protein